MTRQHDLAETREQPRRDPALGGGSPSPVGVSGHVDPGVAEAADLADLTARFFRVLGDSTRLRIVSLLLDAPTGESSVGELVAALAVPQSRVSTHLGCLRWCGLVHARREGKQVYYRITDPRVRELLTLGGAILREHAAGIASCGMLR